MQEVSAVQEYRDVDLDDSTYTRGAISRLLRDDEVKHEMEKLKRVYIVKQVSGDGASREEGLQWSALAVAQWSRAGFVLFRPRVRPLAARPIQFFRFVRLLTSRKEADGNPMALLIHLVAAGGVRKVNPRTEGRP